MEMYELKQRASLPLEQKVALTKQRIKEWCEHFDYNVYVSFSGGKDSTVLLNIVRQVYPECPAVFSDTGLEFPEIRDFVKENDGVTWIKPKMSFREVLTRYGYPLPSKEVAQFVYELRHTRSAKLRDKRWGQLPIKWRFLLDAPFEVSHLCCTALKKSPFHTYERQTGYAPFIGNTFGESNLRIQSYLKTGCNAFDAARKRSMPMAFWTESDVWQYITEHSLPISPIYTMGYERTGCMFCMFNNYPRGIAKKFDLMKETHPNQYRYCMENLGMVRF